MTDQSSDDWLPSGWTVEVRVRRNGKKDKFYFAPSSKLRFNSRPEVSRYLKTQKISDPKPELKIRGNPKKFGKRKNVIVEKVIPEGLPPGWIKEIKETKKGHKIRRDMLYTDPASGYVFRSMKDVLRYLETGNLGRLAYKPKDKESIEVELEDDNISSPAVAKKQKLALSSTREPIICDQSSKLDEMVKDEQISSCTEECVPLSDQLGRLDTDFSSSNLPEAKGSEQIEGKNDSAESVFASAPAVGCLPANQPLESKGTMHENEKTKLDRFKSKNKQKYNLPRRASKRLAGLDVDPTPELKTSRARRVVAKLSGEAGASTPPCSSPGSLSHWESQQHGQLKAGLDSENNFHSSKSTKVLVESINSKHAFAELNTPVEHTGKIERETKDDQKQKSSAVLPVGNLAISEEHAGKVEKENQDNEKPDIPIDLPSMDLWSDPCIQFAIKTLTGVGIDSPKGTELSQLSNNRQQATGDLATLATPEHTRKVETAINGKKQGSTVVLPSGDLAIPVEHAGKVENNCKDYDMPGSPLNMDFGDLWRDPCIEFAVKTLTGAIPVDCVIDIQDSFQTQQSSSQNQASSALTSSNVGFNNSCQTNFLCQQFDAVEKPSYRHQALIEPVLPQTGNVSLQNSGTILHQHSEGRGTRCQ